MRIGSLFSGYGGLEMGVQSVIGGEVAWHVEFDAAPSKILAHRFPGVPNYGDITKVDWSAVEPVDVLTGGFPCQDVSLAGLRRGLKEGTRSGLWSEFARAIGYLRPGLVVIENVRGLLSAVAAGPVESDPWGLGDGSARPSLRALGAVLGDLADLGYDARWCGVRAADAGAPHSRFRVFVLANPTGQRWGEGWTKPARWERRSEAECCGASSDTAGIGSERRNGSEPGPSAAALHTAADTASRGCDGWAQVAIGEALERVATTGGRRADCPITHTDRDGFESIRWLDPEQRDIDGPDGANRVWGAYEPTIRRWERTLGRIAPSPTEPTGKGGAQRLSPVFVEWMMGLPAGWLTDPAIGLTRNQQLKALGNGVVPQQAALAVRTLLQAEEMAA